MRDHTSLVAWQVADAVATQVFEIATAHWRPHFGPAWDQLKRASLSTALNLAEGYRWRPGARWRFHLRVANGSALETTEVLRFLVKLGGIEPESGLAMVSTSERCERLIWGLLRRSWGFPLHPSPFTLHHMSTVDPARIWAPSNPRPAPSGECVLYWMQVTHRAHDNQALNFAVEQANALGVPVLVYHALRHDYPWASDRLHTFILEGVRDLVADFAARGIQYACYLDDRDPADRDGGDSPLVALAQRARLVVTDWFPTFIVPRQVKRLRERVDVPVVAVDSATVVPAKLLDKPYSAARWIRGDLMKLLDDWLHPVGDVEPDHRRAVDLPFAPTRPGSDIAALVAGCAIDHSVPPARGFVGGTHAGRSRLAWWLEHGLPRYLDRNDPNLDVTSRLSPHLHFGHLSPQEVLLAARAAGPDEPWRKFLDEMVTWRELAINFCHHQPRHRTVDAIPEWARRELAEHEADPREARYSDEELERGETDDALWNACQRAYLRDGWMPNYLRMLWGKSVIGWTENAARALRILEHLNNKYALDGRDPNSYGGILWCFGRFDRPFFRRPVFGTVRYMSTRAARKKFDVDAYIGSTIDDER